MAQINIPLDIDSLEITAQSTDKQGNIILDVVSKNTTVSAINVENPRQNAMA